jgi:hypothetical protein
MRVGQKQKKIDINIPKLNDFIHKSYINVARKIYKNVYLFEINIPPLLSQKNNRELEIIVQECILNSVRDSIPIESILRAYMDETIEEDVVEEIKEQIEDIIKPTNVQNEVISETNNDIKEQSLSNDINVKQSLSFNDIDTVLDNNNKKELINAPKTIERLEEISTLRNIQRKMDEEDDNDNEKLNISDQEVSLNNLDIHNIEEPGIKLSIDPILDDIEILT